MALQNTTGGSDSTTDEEQDSTDTESSTNETTTPTSTTSSTSTGSGGGAMDRLQDQIEENEAKAPTNNSTTDSTTDSGSDSTTGGGAMDRLQDQIEENEAKAPTNDPGTDSTTDSTTGSGTTSGSDSTTSPSGGGGSLDREMERVRERAALNDARAGVSTGSGAVWMDRFRDQARENDAKARAVATPDRVTGGLDRVREKARENDAKARSTGVVSGFEPAGVEAEEGRVGEQATRFEAAILAERPYLSRSDVRITREARDGGVYLVAEFSPEAQREVVARRDPTLESGDISIVSVDESGRATLGATASGRRELDREFVDANIDQVLGGVKEAGARGPRRQSKVARGMRIDAALAYDQAVASANRNLAGRRDAAYESPRERQANEVKDYDWSALSDALESVTGADVPLGGDPDRDEVEDFLRAASEKWATENIGFGPLYQSNTSVQDIKEGTGRELTNAQQASETYAESQGMTNAEYGMSQLMGAPVASRGPGYVSRTNAETLGVLPSTIPLNAPAAAHGAMETLETGYGLIEERKQAQQEAIQALAAGSPGPITENPGGYRDLLVQASTGLPTADTESARTLRQGGRYATTTGKRALEYAAENPNKAITGGAAVAAQALVGGAALSRAPGAATRLATRMPDGSSARRFLGEERAMAKLTGRAKQAGETGIDVSRRAAARIKNPSLRDVDPRRTSRDYGDGGGNPEARGLDEQGSFVGSYTRQQDPAFGGTGKPNQPGDFSGVSDRLAEGSYKITGRQPDLTPEDAISMSYGEFAAANRATGRAMGIASGVAGAASSRLEQAQRPQAVLDDPVTGRPERLGYPAALYGGTLAGQRQQYRTREPTIADTTQLWSDQPARDVQDADQEVGLTVAQDSITDTAPASRSRSDTDVAAGTTADTATDTDTTVDVDVGQPAGQGPGKMQPALDTPVVGVPEKPTPQRPVPGPNPLRYPYSPRRTPDPDLGTESKRKRPRSGESRQRPRLQFDQPGRATNPVNELAAAMVLGLTGEGRGLPDADAISGSPDATGPFGTVTELEVSGSKSEQEALMEAKALLSGLNVAPSAFFDTGDAGTEAGDASSDSGGFDWF